MQACICTNRLSAKISWDGGHGVYYYRLDCEDMKNQKVICVHKAMRFAHAIQVQSPKVTFKRAITYGSSAH